MSAAAESLSLNLPNLNFERKETIGIPNKARTKEMIKYITTLVNKYIKVTVANNVMIGIIYFFKLML